MDNILNNEVINKRLNEVTKIAIKDDSFTISDVQVARMKDGSVGKLYHYFGKGISGNNNDRKSFDVILKIIHRWQRFGDPESWNREAKLYETNIFDELVDGGVVPKCFALDDISNDEVHIWMEYVTGANGDDMEIGDFGAPAYHLGMFHGNLKTPQYTFLSSRYIPAIYAIQWGGASIDWLLKDASKQNISDDMKHDVLEVWNNRDSFMKHLLMLPSTLCHRDFNYENVFVRDDKVKIIDWDTAGIGVLGEDIADFTCEALVYKRHSVSQAVSIKNCLMKNYIKGLRDSGWRGDAGDIRLGYAITVALHWTFRCLMILSCADNEKVECAIKGILDFCIAEAKIAKDMINDSKGE